MKGYGLKNKKNISSVGSSLPGVGPFMPNASFIILFRITGQVKPAEYDYTHEYIPKK
jgi:hypothetical protein